MKYVSFYNVVTESMYDGFVVNENKEYFYTVDPICYEWLVKMDRLDLIEKIDGRKFEKDFFSYREVNLLDNWSFMKNHEWLFDFPLEESDFIHVHSIANFFEWIVRGGDTPIHEIISNAKNATKYTLSSEVQGRISTFIIDHYRDDPNRLRIFFGK